MPQIQQYGTSNVLAHWQGIPSPSGGGGHGSINSLAVRAAFQCTLTFVSTGLYNLAINQDLEDADTQIEVDACDGGIYDIVVTWLPNGTANIGFTQIHLESPRFVDPGLFNITVLQCSDFVDQIEGSP
jgi:hypothetical protein